MIQKVCESFEWHSVCTRDVIAAHGTAVYHRLPHEQVVAAESGVVFLDMHGPGAYEKQTGETLCNPAEADLVMQLVDALLAGGVPLSAIGGMSPYRSQVMLAKSCCLKLWADYFLV